MEEDARYAVTDPTKVATFGHDFTIGESLIDSIKEIQSLTLERAKTLATMRLARIQHSLSVLPEGWGLAVSPLKADPDIASTRMTFEIMPIPPEGEPTPIPAGWEIFRPKKLGPYEG